MTKEVRIKRNGARNLWKVVGEIHRTLQEMGTPEWFSWIIRVELRGGLIVFEVEKPE